ncbi:MAG: hypothetical protein CL723_04315 [Chloroflexi bacterium]|nr:hypothetical protein [Chloroflexota bacterium]|tara:strand:- start:2331 stop:3587 length:1257 start_codon:yes stop_codon:yes gene_type:complete
MIALLDCNNFYASCERVFRPDLIRKPIIVLSNNDGCVIARSDEVKKMGIKMGTPIFKIRNLISENDISIFSSNFALYGDISRRIMKILQNTVFDLEIYSIDEAFIDFMYKTDIEYESLNLVCKILQWTGIPVSIGISSTKTLAKIANHFAKKVSRNNILFLDTEKIINFYIKKIDIADVWGIGYRYARFLYSKGIYTAYDLAKKNDKWILDNMSIIGLKTVYELRGIKCFELQTSESPKKNIRNSRTFSRDTNDYNKIKKAISSFASKTAEKLRAQKCVTSSISVFINTNKYKYSNQNRKLNGKVNLKFSTNDTSIIISESLKILDEIYIPGLFYKQAGIIISDFSVVNQNQLGLFEDVSKKIKREKLMTSLDYINSTIRNESIKLASEEFENDWRVNQSNLSPAYTTRWKEILSVNI